MGRFLMPNVGSTRRASAPHISRAAGYPDPLPEGRPGRASRPTVVGLLQRFAVPTRALIATAGLVSCGNASNDTTAPPPAGLLAVGTATTGADLDPDGYSLTIAGPAHWAHSERAIGDSETAKVSLPVGRYSLTLTGVRFNCQVISANPQHVDVAAVANPPVQFAIGCVERPVASVDIEPRPTSLGVGESLPLQATPFDAEVSPLWDRSVTWASSPTAQATVSSAGLVLGVAHGSATITATSEGTSGSLSLAIGDPAASVIVSPASVTIGDVACSTQLTAALLDPQGHQIAGRQVTWTTSDASIALVSPVYPPSLFASASPAATVLAVHAGTATLTASTGLQSGSATVTVAARAEDICHSW